MKRVKELPFFKNIREIREYQFGTFYFFDQLVIGEFNNGVSVNWDMGQRLINASKEIYGDHVKIGYISNRINNYQLDPTDWAKFYKKRHQLEFYFVVGQTKGSFTSLVMERMFFKGAIKQFSDLEKAIDWGLKKMQTTHDQTNISPNLSTDMK